MSWEERIPIARVGLGSPSGSGDHEGELELANGPPHAAAGRKLVANSILLCVVISSCVLLLLQRVGHSGSHSSGPEAQTGGADTSFAALLVASQPSLYSQPLDIPDARFATSRRGSEGSEEGGEDGAGSILHTELRVEPVFWEVGPVAFHVRAYEGSVPGPTLYISPGSKLVIDLVNNLEPQPEPDGLPFESSSSLTEDTELVGKDWSAPNATNLHVHGLHVSPSGIADNIYRKCPPGKALQYRYDVPRNHYYGQFYYHPHHEGSSTIQTMGGMAGAILVREEADFQGGEVRLDFHGHQMRTIVLVLQEMNVPKYSYYASTAAVSSGGLGWGGADFATAAKDLSAAHLPLEFFAVNGQFQPVLEVKPGETVVLEVLNAGSAAHLCLFVDDVDDGEQQEEKQGGHEQEEDGEERTSCGCEMRTLARDGVYLDAPRKEEVVMAPGSRAEIAIRCGGGKGCRGGGGGGGGAEERSKRTVRIASSKHREALDAFLTSKGANSAFYEVEGDAVDTPLPTATPPRSRHDINKDVGKDSRSSSDSSSDSWSSSSSGKNLLADLRSLSPVEYSTFIFEFNQDKSAPREVNGLLYSTAYGINGQPYDVSTIQRTVALGAAEEWLVVNQVVGSEGMTLGGMDRTPTTSTHPFHLHVNHFQIVGFEAGAGGGGGGSSSGGEEEGGDGSSSSSASALQSVDWRVGDWRDTITVPAPGNVTLRWRADDFTGVSLAHCHIFSHADTGMALNFEVFEEP